MGAEEPTPRVIDASNHSWIVGDGGEGDRVGWHAVSDGTVWCVTEAGEVLALAPGGEAPVLLQGSGVLLWQELVRGAEIEDTLSAMLQHFPEVPADQLRQDVKFFFEKVCAMGLATVGHQA